MDRTEVHLDSKTVYVDPATDEEEPYIKRKDHLWKPGQSGNPAGRKPGQSLTEFARGYFYDMTLEEKKAYIQAVEAKRPGFMLEIAEGKARENKHISISAPTPILGGSTGALSIEDTKQIQGEIAKEVLD